MKTVEIGQIPPSVGDLLKLAESDSVVLRTADGREYILSEVDDADLEVARMRQNEELMTFLDECSKDQSRVSLDEARRELGI